MYALSTLALFSVLTLAVAPAAVVAQVTRAAFIEEMGRLYVRTARAKGCSRRRATLSHALRNTWMSVATTLALEVTYVVGGGVLVENVFNWPGIGKASLHKQVLAVIGKCHNASSQTAQAIQSPQPCAFFTHGLSQPLCTLARDDT